MDENTARAKIYEIGFSWTLPRALYVAAELGIADALGDGSKSVERIAADIGAHAPSLERLLRLLVKHEIFHQDGQGQIHLNPVSRLLRSDTPGSLRDFIRWDNEALWAAYGDLPHTVKTGEPGFDHVHGKDFFAYLTSDVDAAVRADAAQRSLSVPEEQVIAQAYDFSGAGTIVDLGGGRGGLLTEILKTCPDARGVLGDMPQVVKNPERLRESGLLDRCDVRPVDFFESVPEGGDVYILKRIIHDWGHKHCVRILENVHRAMNDGARLLIIEGIILPQDTTSLSRECDVAIMTFLGGRIRSEEEFGKLFSETGFELVKTVPATSLVSIMELRKA